MVGLRRALQAAVDIWWWGPREPNCVDSWGPGSAHQRPYLIEARRTTQGQDGPAAATTTKV